MYDNLDISLTKEQSPGANFLKEIPQYLTMVSNHGVNQFGEYITGYCDNLKVSISESRVKIYDCSLCCITDGNRKRLD